MRTKLAHVIVLTVGLLLLSVTSAFSYTFYLDQFNQQNSGGPYVKVDVTNPNATTAVITLSSQTNDGFTYAFNEVGLNLNSYDTIGISVPGENPPRYTLVDHSGKPQQMDGFDSYRQIITQQKNGNAGFDGSITQLILTVSGLSGPLFVEGQRPVVAHIFPMDPIDGSLVGKSGYAGMTPTPIPAAAWLLASGLLALIGIKRTHANQNK